MKISNNLLRTAIWGNKKLAGFLQIEGHTDRNFVVFSSQQVLHFDLEVKY